MHDIQDNLGVKNMSYLTINTIKGYKKTCKTKSPTEEQIKKHIRYGK